MTRVKRTRLWPVAMALALVLPLSAGFLRAHHAETSETIRLEHPFEVPGQTLEANTTYVLHVHPSTRADDRHVIEFRDEQGDRALTSFLGVSDEMPGAGETAGLDFFQMQAVRGDDARPVRGWTHEEWGTVTFVYPEEQARQIAENTGEPVLSTTAEVSAQTQGLAAVEVTTIEAERGAEEGRTLPRTATPLPLWAALGATAMGLGLALRRVA